MAQPMLSDFKDGSPIIEQNPHPCFDKVIQQGYRLFFRFHATLRGNCRDLDIVVRKGDDAVAGANFTDHPEGLAFCDQNIWVHEDHRRRKIGTAMYVFAEKLVGKPLDNILADISDGQSDAARALWAQPDRPFGARR